MIYIKLFIEGLKKLGCTVIENAPMKDYNSFRTGGNCDYLIKPNSIDNLSEILKKCTSNSVPYTVLGNGSNVLVSDDGIKGIVILIGEGLNTIKLLDDNTIYCEAGVKLGTLCNFALEHSLTGLEFAFGIPGTLGGALFMNAGAYESEMKNVVARIHHLNKNGEKAFLDNKSSGFGYRTSAYQKNGFVITGAEIKLEKGEKADIQAKMNELLNKRKEKQPLEYPSAGSTFKRPENNFAGALIEQCGLKGKQIGGAMVSEKHAGFIINYDNASSSDIEELIAFVKDTVLKEKGVLLTPEIRFLR